MPPPSLSDPVYTWSLHVHLEYQDHIWIKTKPFKNLSSVNAPRNAQTTAGGKLRGIWDKFLQSNHIHLSKRDDRWSSSSQCNRNTSNNCCAKQENLHTEICQTEVVKTWSRYNPDTRERKQPGVKKLSKEHQKSYLIYSLILPNIWP